MNDLERETLAYSLITELFNEGKIPERFLTDGSLASLIYLWNQHNWSLEEFREELERALDFQASIYGLE